MTLMHMKMHDVQKVRPGSTEGTQARTLAEILKRPDIHKLIELQDADALGTTLPGRFERSNRSFLLSKLEELQASTASRK